MNVMVSNVTLVDNGMEIMPMIYGPPSLSHEFANKTVLIQVRCFILINWLLFFCGSFVFAKGFNSNPCSPRIH